MIQVLLLLLYYLECTLLVLIEIFMEDTAACECLSPFVINTLLLSIHFCSSGWLSKTCKRIVYKVQRSMDCRWGADWPLQNWQALGSWSRRLQTGYSYFGKSTLWRHVSGFWCLCGWSGICKKLVRLKIILHFIYFSNLLDTT